MITKLHLQAPQVALYTSSDKDYHQLHFENSHQLHLSLYCGVCYLKEMYEKKFAVALNRAMSHNTILYLSSYFTFSSALLCLLSSL